VDASLRGALRPGSPLLFSCATIDVSGNVLGRPVYVQCDQPHNAEFAGAFVANDIQPGETPGEAGAGGCWEVGAAYAGLRMSESLTRRIRMVRLSPRQVHWDRGNHAISCVLLFDRNVSKLMKGGGPSAFPDS